MEIHNVNRIHEIQYNSGRSRQLRIRWPESKNSTFPGPIIGQQDFPLKVCLDSLRKKIQSPDRTTLALLVHTHILNLYPYLCPSLFDKNWRR